MNSEKWRKGNREQTILPEVLKDLIASHLYALRGMDKREIVDLDLPDYFKDGIQVKIKLKEDKLVDQSSIKE